MRSTMPGDGVVLLLAVTTTLTVGCSRTHGKGAGYGDGSLAAQVDADTSEVAAGEQQLREPEGTERGVDVLPNTPGQTPPAGGELKPSRTPEAVAGPSADALSAEESARRLAVRLNADQAKMQVGEVFEYLRRPCRRALLDDHDPPLKVIAEATTGMPVYVECRWEHTVIGLAPPSPTGPQKPVIGKDEARNLAVRAAEEWFGGVPEEYVLLVDDLYDMGGAGMEYYFRWRGRRDDILLPARIEIQIDALKGRPANGLRVVDPVEVPLEIKVSEQVAGTRALAATAQWVRKGEAAGIKEAFVEVGHGLEKNRDTQQLRWRMKVQVTKPEPRPIALVTVDAASGEVLDILRAKSEDSHSAKPR